MYFNTVGEGMYAVNHHMFECDKNEWNVRMNDISHFFIFFIIIIFFLFVSWTKHVLLIYHLPYNSIDIEKQTIFFFTCDCTQHIECVMLCNVEGKWDGNIYTKHKTLKWMQNLCDKYGRIWFFFSSVVCVSLSSFFVCFFLTMIILNPC